MSPEQCNGGAIDRRTDVYAMGVILYQMLTGRLPFIAGKLTELLIAQATQAPPPLRSIDPGIPPAVENAVLQALEKDPERRFSSVDALARAFVGEARATPLPVTPPPTPSPPVPAAGRGKLPQLVVGGIAAALAIASGIFFATRSPSAPAAVHSPSETPATPAWGGRWRLSHTDCLPGSMPATVESIQTGASFTNHAAGFPDTSGTVEPDGRFRIHNSLGTCSGRVVDRTVNETCTNKLHLSCHATYQRVD